MSDIHIWLLAAQIVGIAVIAMFATYVLLQFVDLRKYRHIQASKEEAIKNLIMDLNKANREILECNGELQKEIRSVISRIQSYEEQISHQKNKRQ